MPRRTLSTRTLVILGVGLGSMLALYSVMPLLAQDSTAGLIVANLETIVPVGIATIVGLWAATTFPRGNPGRLIWLFMGLSIGSYELAAIIAAYYEIFLRAEPPSPGFVDVLYFAGYPLAIVALLVAIRSLGANVNLTKVLLAAFGVAGGLAVLLWYFVLSPSVASPADAINAAYALGDLVIVLPLGIALAYATNRLHPGPEALPWWVVLIGLTVSVFADTLFEIAAASGTLLNGGPVDLAVTLGYFTLGIAASMAVDAARLTTTGEAAR